MSKLSMLFAEQTKKVYMKTRNMLDKSISTILILSLLLGITAGCTSFSPIVGKWQDIQSRDTIEFTSGGDVIAISSGNIMTGKYELIGSDVVKVRFEGFGGAWMSLFGGDTWQYEISGNTMTVKVANRSAVFKRIK